MPSGVTTPIKLGGIRQMLPFKSWEEKIEGFLLIEELNPTFRLDIPNFKCLFHTN